MPRSFSLFLGVFAADAVLTLISFTQLGFSTTALYVLITCLIGINIINRQKGSLGTAAQTMFDFSSPANMLAPLSGYVAGGLLVWPGPVSDFLGVLLLLKPIRSWFIERWTPLGVMQRNNPEDGIKTGQPPYVRPGPAAGNDDVSEATWEDLPPDH